MLSSSCWSKKISIILEDIKIAREKVGSDDPTIGDLEKQITLISDMVSIKSFMKWSIKNPDVLKKALEYSIKATIEYSNLMSHKISKIN